MARTIGRIGSTLALFTLLAIGLSACGGSSQPAASSAPIMGSTAAGASSGSKVKVVVTLPVFTSMVQAIGGDRVTVTSIVPPGVEAHTYQPTPSNVRDVADARVVFVNGAGLEEWLRPLIESAGGSRVPVYELSLGLTPVDGNPHFWLDPTDAARYAQRIAQGLSEHDLDGADLYRANAEKYTGEIRAFDDWAKGQIAEIPAERRKLVTFHDAYPYFASHFGLQLVGFVEKSPGREPSPQELTGLVNQIKAQQVPVIFAEPQFNPKLADTLANEAGIKVATLYSDTPPQGQGYLEMMRSNVQNVVEGLR
ncbi:metal ABC transporter substrate-binding protein [Nitrolancea hollandica]|uniref:Periplasmic solute binding protein n=1 Tax=Nitrolancea hollandica Lb TaxID=1129897 RepID=I4EJZ7_9BACT|nr:metal ABC transporter substrate-binding protein [Nitrolancea hollandica]CCF85009.1 Periplasmic solute binding protein [Nitrolancea hollandica Lb]